MQARHIRSDLRASIMTLIEKRSLGVPCEVRPAHHGSVHLSDLMRADIQRSFGKSQPMVKQPLWKRIWGWN